MKTKQKTTAELMREAFVRLGARPILIDGEPVPPVKAKRPAKPSGNGSKR